MLKYLMNSKAQSKKSVSELSGVVGMVALALPLFMSTSVVAQDSFPLDGRTLQQHTAEDVLFTKAVKSAKNFEPAIVHQGQMNEAAKKLKALEAKTGKRPNIVVVLMDDVGWGDVGVNGGGSAVGAVTPNIDKLAENGLNLTSLYSQPSCTPTRAALLTGQLPVRNGLLRPALPGEGGKGLGGAVTIAQILKDSGYTTEAIGKWHLGQHKSAQPQNVGFEHYVGPLTSSDDYTSFMEPWRNPDIVNDPKRMKWAQGSETLAIVEGVTGEAAKPIFEINMDSIRHVDEELTKHGVNFIKKQEKSEKPFFLYFATRGAHFDNYPHPDFAGKSGAKYPYRDVILELDYRIGQLVGALEETNQLENTLILVTSDNGPMLETFPDMGHTPFRGGKGTSFEGGVRVPGVVYWKGMIEPGRVSDGLFDMTDMFMTAASLGKVKDDISSKAYIDGIDQTSFLVSEQGLSNRRSIFYWSGSVFMGARVGEYKWLVNEQNYESANNWPYASPFQSSVTPSVYGGKLYNLYVDPLEEHAFLPLKQPFLPVILPEMVRHLKSFKEFKPKARLRGLEALSGEG